MGNVLIGYGNIVEKGSLAGGVSHATMPLTNLQTMQLGIKWRAATLAEADTQFTLTLPEGNAVRVIALANHNLGIDAEYRLRCNSDPAFPGPTPTGYAGTPWGGLLIGITKSVAVDPLPPADYYDGGWTNVWPVVFSTEDLEWEMDNFWSGTYQADEIEGYTKTLIVILPEIIRPQYIRLEIRDPNNPDGFVEAGRLFVATAWQPVRNASYGATLGWQNDTEVQVAESEEEYFNEKKSYRVAKVTFNYMTATEALVGPYEIARRMGVSKEILFVFDPDDTYHAIRRQFLGRFTELNPLEFPQYFMGGEQRATMPMVIKERVG